MNNPKSRDRELVVQEIGKEVLIYDLSNNRAYSLNETSAIIWKLCDGKSTVGQMSRLLAEQLKSPVSEELIWLALDSFKQNNLLADNENVRIELNGLSRRQVIRKVGFASMIALPIVSSLVAPTAAHAQSGLALNVACTSDSQCQSGNCQAGTAQPGTRCCAATAANGSPTDNNGAPGQAIGCADSACATVNSCCSGSASPGTPINACTARGATTCYCN